jgi:hypothetical protein
MTKLHPDLEALMPEPFGYVPFAGEFYPPDELDAEVKNDPDVPAVYTATQMREAILAATERAAKARQAVVPAEADEAFRLKKLTGQLVAPVGRGYAEGWKAGYEAALEAVAIRSAAASTGRGEGGEGA